MGVVLVVGKFQANRVVVHVDRKVVLTKVGRWSQTDTDFDAVGGHGTEGLDATETKVEEGWGWWRVVSVATEEGTQSLLRLM